MDSQGQKWVKEDITLLQKAIMIELNRNVKRLLTGQYLGVFTGAGRNTTAALIYDNTVYFGTYQDYMGAYETGDWTGVKEDKTSKRLYDLKFKGRRNNTWKGDRKKRPFLRDTIEDGKVLQNISQRFLREVALK